MRFPAGFRWGTQTAATQVEGGGIDNDFTRWAEADGHIRDGTTPNPGLDHWNRVELDYEHLQARGHTAHALTIDWARVEPRPGCWDEAALEHYRHEIATARRCGMEPVVTLMQYALPVWIADRGGITDGRTVHLFARFATRCAEALGDQVTWWITLNEPVVHASMGYFLGMWPPGERDIRKLRMAMAGVLEMHAAAAAALRGAARAHGRQVRISVAHHMRPMRPHRRWSPMDQLFARIPDYLLNHWFLDCCRSGRLRPPVGRGQRIPGLRRSLDFVGLNYYTRDRVHFAIGGSINGVVDYKLDRRKPVSTFDWNVDPDGMYETAMRVWKQLGLPVMVTENGVADVNDELRPRFLIDHLAALHHCMRDGVPVLGYLHWTDWDNWEWAEGFAQRFGLMSFDPATGDRRDKFSARVFQAIIERNAVPEAWLTPDNLRSPVSRDRYAAREARRPAERRVRPGGAR